jgi:hypothetical protein
VLRLTGIVAAEWMVLFLWPSSRSPSPISCWDVRFAFPLAAWGAFSEVGETGGGEVPHQVEPPHPDLIVGFPQEAAVTDACAA